MKQSQHLIFPGNIRNEATSAYREPEETLWRHLNTLHAAVGAISWKLVHTALLLLSETEGP